MFLGHYSDRQMSCDQTSDRPVVSQCNVVVHGKTFALEFL